MAKSDRFRRQHDELLALANELAAELDTDKLAKDGAPARSALSKLAGKLTLHLGAEDEHLYPELMQSANDDVRNTAQQFVDEMGGIAAAFVAYNDKWRAASSIQNDPAGFVEETKAIYGALAGRIEQENTKLYPLMDNMAA